MLIVFVLEAFEQVFGWSVEAALQVFWSELSHACRIVFSNNPLGIDLPGNWGPGSPFNPLSGRMVERKREIVESAHYGAPIITIAYENMILLSNIESVRKYGTRNGHAQSDDTRPSDRACAKTRAHLRALCTRDREESFSDKPELIRIMARTRRHTSPTHIHSRFITIDEYCHHSSFYQWLPNQCPGALPLPHKRPG